MAGEQLAVRDGFAALAGHNQTNGLSLSRIFADEQGNLRVDAGIKNMQFTWNVDSTVNTIDVVRVVDNIDVTKRLSFTWSSGKLQSIAATIL
jgi:hypothetical protein